MGRKLIVSTRTTFDPRAYCALGGLTGAEIAAVRARLLDGDAVR
jgi:hypothetical protein